MIIGITGSFGTGKTTVADMFRSYGFKVINADRLYKSIYKKNKLLAFKIFKEFGTLDRDKIKEIVFNDYNKLKKLNKITHPIIISGIKKEVSTIIKRYNKKNSMIKKYNNLKLIKNNVKSIGKNNNKINGPKIKIIIDAPLLIEAGAKNLVDKLIVVKCSKKEQIKRTLKKKKYTKKEIENIIKSQMPLNEKIKHADFVVDNDKTLKEAKKQVKAIANVLQKP